MKAILPMAGFGTRLRPLTLSQPKYLLGVADKPLLQYAIDELISAGVSDFVFVISPNQGKVRHYIEAAGLKRARFALQGRMLGNAHAILKAAKFVSSSEPTVVSFGDDVLVEGADVMRRMIALSKATSSPVLLLDRVPKVLVSRYGIVAAKSFLAKGITQNKDTFEISNLVEKPDLKDAPSNLSIVGRYVLSPQVFKNIKELCSKKENMAKNGEFYLTDALLNYLNTGGKIYGIEFKGQRFDCGSKLGLFKAGAYFSLKHKELGKDFGVFLNTLR